MTTTESRQPPGPRARDAAAEILEAMKEWSLSGADAYADNLMEAAEIIQQAIDSALCDAKMGGMGFRKLPPDDERKP